MSRACRKLHFHSYKIVTCPAYSVGVLALRLRFCRAWQALPEAEKGNVAYSDETMFTLHGSTNRQNQRRYAVPEHKGGTGRLSSLQIDQHHYDKKLMVFLCEYSVFNLLGSDLIHDDLF